MVGSFRFGVVGTKLLVLILLVFFSSQQFTESKQAICAAFLVELKYAGRE